MSKHGTSAGAMLPKSCDVAIVGSGPAGLATAIELKKRGVSNVIVLERFAEAGGNPRHCGHSPFGMSEFKRIYKGPGYVRKMLATANQLGVKIFVETTVTEIAAQGALTLSTPQGLRRIQAKRVVLSAGIREKPRAPRLVSGQRPLGITTTGALQSMVYLGHKKPFERCVIIGSELVSFSAIASCRHAGIKPLCLIEENSRLTAWAGLQLYPRLMGVDVLPATRLIDIEGKSRVSGVNLMDANGNTKHVSCDGVIFTGQFVPEASLLRNAHLEIDPHTGGPVIDQYGRCSDPAYFAAGNMLRPVETAGWCWSEGVSTAGFVQLSLAAELPGVEAQQKVRIGNPGLKYIIPQRISVSKSRSQPEGMKKFQLRVATPVEGRVSLLSGDSELYSRKVKALPERRILMPLPPLDNTGYHSDLVVNLSKCESG